MHIYPATPSVPTICHRSIMLAAAAAAALASAGCSAGPALNGMDGATSIADASAARKTPQSELDKAIEYWGREFTKTPHSLKAALNYARNLKAAGRKQEAFRVVQSASLLHGDSKELASEYGRLALEFDQVEVANKVLAMADDPSKPDWRIISARGTALAKQGKYGAALPFYERALQLAPDQPSVMNNLALTYVADGKPEKAEQILRKAATTTSDPKVKQNLALVLGLQGKHSEAEKQAATVLPAATASADADYLRQLVRYQAPAQSSAQSPAQSTVKAPLIAASAAADQSKGGGEPSLSAEAIIAMAKAQHQPQNKRPARPGSSAPALRDSRGTNEVAGNPAALAGPVAAAR